MTTWKTVSIPKELFEKIGRIVADRPDLYTSVSDFIRDACDRRIVELDRAKQAERRIMQERKTSSGR